MSKLKAIEPKAASPSKPKILLFGKPGVGKTWTALDFPSVYYIDTEGGANLSHYTDKLKKSGGVYMGLEQGALDFDIVLAQVRALATEKHKYRTLVIDSISKLFGTSIAIESDRLGDKNAFGADKKLAVSSMRKLVSWLTTLDMNVILIAHSKTEWGKNSTTGQREEVGDTFDCWDKLEYELHLALQIFSVGPYPARARVRKTRLLGFPMATLFPWTYEEFASRYGKDLMERAAIPVKAASPERVSKLKELIEIVKLKEGEVEKWLAKAGVDALEDMPADAAEKCITMIENKISVKKEGESK